MGIDLQHVMSYKKWTGHKVDWDEIHPSLPATICVHDDPVTGAVDVCTRWCKAHMGPPPVVPLRDVSCVIILLYLFLLLSIAPSLSLQALTSGKTLRYVRGLAALWSTILVNRAKTQMHCGGMLQGAAGSGQVHFLTPHGCLTSGVRAARPLHQLCSRMSVPSCWQPNQGERRVAESPRCWPYPSPTAETPGCYPILLANFYPPPRNPTSCQQK